MLARLSVWILAAALGQPGAEPAWLKSIPDDVDLAIRTRGLEPTRNGLSAMLKATSPALAAQLEPQLRAFQDSFKPAYGTAPVSTPWVALVRTAAKGPGGAVPFGLLILDGDQAAVLKRISGGKDVALKTLDGGISSFTAPLGDLWYVARGSGFVAVGDDRALIAAIARPGAKTLDKRLTPALAGPFLSSDVGVYVNAAALTTRNADAIEQAKQTFLGAIDQAGQQQGNAAAMQRIKPMYARFFDGLKDANLLTLGFDFAASGLKLAGVLDARPGTDIAKESIAVHTGTASDLGHFGAGGAAYVYFNLDAEDFHRFQTMGFRMIAPEGKMPPALEQATKRFQEIGDVETTGTSGFKKGMHAVNVIRLSDPKAYIATSHEMVRAMSKGEGPFQFYKDVKVTPGDQTYRGFTFDRVVAKLDLDKLTQLQGQNPAVAGSMRAMFGGDALTYWIGTDGKRVIHLTMPTWEEAVASIDGYLDGKAGIGAVPGFQAVRSALPERASMLMLMSAQGMLNMMAGQLGAQARVPADLPAEPALLGVSLTPQPPRAFEFHLVLPSTIGPIVEKGFVPVFQGLRPPQ